MMREGGDGQHNIIPSTTKHNNKQRDIASQPHQQLSKPHRLPAQAFFLTKRSYSFTARLYSFSRRVKIRLQSLLYLFSNIATSSIHLISAAVISSFFSKAVIFALDQLFFFISNYISS